MSATRLLVLGCVRAYGRAHGYQIGSELQSWGASDWANTKWGSIYHALRHLTKQGLLRTLEPSEGSTRTDYELTPAGAEEFHRLVTTALRRPEHRPDMLAAGLAFLPTLGREEAIGLLQDRISTLEADQAKVAELSHLPGTNGIPDHVHELFGLWSHSAESNIEWTRGLIERLRKGAYPMADNGRSPVSGNPVRLV